MESPFRKPIGATLIADIQFTPLPIRAQNVGAKNARAIQITNTTARRPVNRFSTRTIEIQTGTGSTALRRFAISMVAERTLSPPLP